MSFKIYSLGNQIFVKDNDKIEVPDHKSKVNVWPVNLTPGSEKYTIESPKIGKQIVELDDLVDENDAAYTLSTWTTFYTTETGFKTTAGGSVVINQNNASLILGGVIDSSKEYFIDGIIDLGTTEIIVPVGGINLRGFNFDLSGLTSSEDNYTMFKSETALIGSGNMLIVDLFMTSSGVGSKVYDLTDSDGFHAIELSKLNYIDCTSLGTIDGYRQGLETETGRFGGSPSLTLHGAWLGGYRVTTSIVRNLSALMTTSIFAEGTAFTMQSRFLTDINCDLPALASFLDFNDTNFPNPSTLELRDTIITRDGLTVPEDTNLTPNISSSNLSCSWKDNNGIPNTFVGGVATVTTEVLTVLSFNVPSVLNGTFTNSDLQHFDSPSNGQLRHLGSNPREFTVNFDFVLEGGANDDYKIELVKNDGSDVVVYQQTRVINNLSGGRDVAYFTGLANVILAQNDYAFWQVTNLSDGSNCTLELDSTYSIQER